MDKDSQAIPGIGRIRYCGGIEKGMMIKIDILIAK